MLTPNTGNVGTGSFQVSGLATIGATTSFTLYTIVLTANSTVGATPVTATIGVAGKEAGSNIIVTPATFLSQSTSGNTRTR